MIILNYLLLKQCNTYMYMYVIYSFAYTVNFRIIVFLTVYFQNNFLFVINQPSHYVGVVTVVVYIGLID